MVGYNLEAAKELEKEGVSAEVTCSSLLSCLQMPQHLQLSCMWEPECIRDVIGHVKVSIA